MTFFDKRLIGTVFAAVAAFGLWIGPLQADVPGELQALQALQAVDGLETEAVAPDPPVPLLWKVSAEHRSVYLLGSFHLLRPEDYPLSADIDAVLEDVERVLFELSPEDMTSPLVAMKMGQAALRTDGTLLDSELPAATAQALRSWTQRNAAALQQAQLSPQVLQMFEPWFVALTVSLFELQQFGLDPSIGLDLYLSSRARDAGKATAGLETVDQQIAVFDQLPRDAQIAYLGEALTLTGESGRAEIEALHAAWREGDAELLWQEMALKMREESPSLYQRINTDRNDDWLVPLEQLLGGDADAGNSLVVVGALHLLGEDGVVEKLAAKGYVTERICSACAGAPVR